MTEHHDLINRQTLWFVLTQQSMGYNEYSKSGHLLTFASLKHLLMLLICKFSFYTLLKTPIACRAIQLRFLKGGNIVKHCL